MKEKIWKLIELLNEYWKKEKFWIIRKLWEDPIWVYWYVNDMYWLWWASKLFIISKEYWFIKWLVDNDKIDRDKVEKEKADYYFIEMFDNDEIMLMLLSISSSPIEDLISYLK